MKLVQTIERMYCHSKSEMPRLYSVFIVYRECRNWTPLFESQPSHLLIVWLWISYLTFLCLSFRICKRGILMAAAAAKSRQSCPTLCDPIDGSPPGSPVPGILQARTLEWVASSFSNAGKWEVKAKSLSRVRLFSTPWTAAHQALFLNALTKIKDESSRRNLSTTK